MLLEFGSWKLDVDDRVGDGGVSPQSPIQLFVLLVLVVFVKLGGIAEPKNLTARVPGEDAMGSLGFERHHGDIPRLGAIGGGDTATREALERFQLKHRRRGSYITQSTCWDRHTAPPVAGHHAIQTPA